MTDNEIIKALECCANADCLNCPKWSEEWYSGMCAELLPTALDLIKRQQAEIEHFRDLTKMVKSEAITEYEEKLHPYKLHYGNLKAEIVREFADRLKAESGYSALADADGEEIYGTRVYWISAERLDNLLKEMEKE